MCDHSVVMKGMCCLCGADLHEKNVAVVATATTVAVKAVVQETRQGSQKRTLSSSAGVAMIHSIPELLVSAERAEQLGQADINRLLKKRQLVLLVDLDQTLVHTTNERISADIKDVHHFQMPNGPYQVWYHTKLRPGTAKFLEDISKHYELHIATFGSRLYAHTIAALLDPDKKLFHPSRILSRDECFSPITKTANLANLFPCGDSLVCIIDDRDEVWNYARNLVRVRPYFFFANTGDINAPPNAKKSLEQLQQQKADERAEIDIGHDVKRRKVDDESETKNDPNNVEDTDDYLFYLPDILEKIHKDFYELYDRHNASPENEPIPDVKKIVPQLKAKVLADCRIVFSGVIPKNMPSGCSRPILVAKEFGAQIQDEVVTDPPSQRTTHVIAAYWNTAKVKAAQEIDESSCHIVTINWLWACAERWDRVDERLFLLPKEVDTSSAIRNDERGNRSKKDAKKDGDGPSTSSASAQESPPDMKEDVDEGEGLALSNDQIREMSDEVIKALAEDGISLGSCSSDDEDEERNNEDTNQDEENGNNSQEDQKSNASDAEPSVDSADDS